MKQVILRIILTNQFVQVVATDAEAKKIITDWFQGNFKVRGTSHITGTCDNGDMWSVRVDQIIGMQMVQVPEQSPGNFTETKR